MRRGGGRRGNACGKRRRHSDVPASSWSIADREWNGGGTGDEIAICADTRTRNLHPNPARGARSGMSVMLITVIGFGHEMGY